MGKDESRPMIHVAGNSVLDLLLHNVPGEMGAVDGWSAGNVHFLSDAPEYVLGGNGGSVAYLLGRLGERVSLNTCVGNDAFGQILCEWFGQSEMVLVGEPAGRTAVNTILLSPEGHRRSIYYTGEKVDWRRSLEVVGAAWFYASGYGQVTVDDLHELVDVFKAFQSRGAKVVFDPGPWFFASVRPEEMQQAWQDVFCLIGTEAELGGRQSYDHVEGLVEWHLKLGPEVVVIKRGGEGAAFGSQKGEMGMFSTDRVDGANTVGAGDTFNAGLLHSLCRREGLEAAVRTGLHLATQAVKNGRGVLGALGKMR